MNILEQYLNNLTSEKALEFITAYDSSDKFKQIVDMITKNAEDKDFLDKIIDFIRRKRGHNP